MTFAQCLENASAAPLDPDILDDLARFALAEEEEAQALQILVPAARRAGNALLWQWTGLLQRALDDHLEAFASLTEARRLEPTDFAIAHALARVALEAGWDAVAHFDRARALGPPTSELLMGLSAARFAQGRGEEAAAEIDAILAVSPFWLDGHRHLAQLRTLLGEPDRAAESLERTIAEHPSDERLWFTLLDLDLAASMFGHLERDVARAEAAGVAHSLGAYAAIAASEQGDVDRADPLFATAHVPAIWRIRHLLRAGRAPETLPLIDAALAGADANAVWPYAATAWRETKDPRFEWLVRVGDLVSVIDLDWPSGQIEETADILRRLHETSGEFFDQSVRGGTQTGGPLFSRTEPQIRQLRKDMVDAVAQYTAALPEADPSHPLLGPRRDRAARFSGSWSVRLRGSGFHERHVHTRGWLSSALYLALPEGEAGGATKQGTLELGAPPTTLRLGQAPLRQVEPAVGRLVLFPSWLWHGTQPFDSGERLTIAFDVGPRP